jgi:ElaB/YqjD/DUF883 family membrane-anchored ribosome-binding protein
MAPENETGQPTENLKSAAGEIVGQYRQKTEQLWDDARLGTRMFRQDAEQYVRDNPTIAVCTAFGIGLVLGLIIFRR